MSLDAEKFEEFYCPNPTNVSVNLISIFKIIKGIKNSDSVSFYILKEEPFVIYVKHSNISKKCTHVTKLNLLDIDDKIYQIPNMHFDSYIVMSSSDFLSYITELSTVSNEVCVSSYNGSLILKSTGDFAEQTISIESSTQLESNPSNDSKNCVSTVSGVFNIKYILMFTKSTNLCNTVEIYIKDKYPLTLLYNVANLGVIKFCLVPD